MKYLYFDRYTKDSVGTAFHTTDGTPIFLDIQVDRETRPSMIYVGDCYIIADEWYKRKSLMDGFCYSDGTPKRFPCNVKEILQIVNGLGGDFDIVNILLPIEGYRVFGSYRKYHFGDEFKYDCELPG